MRNTPPSWDDTLTVPLNDCPLCGRPLPIGRTVDRHHMIPKCKKGTDTETIHIVCHRKIHSVFTEKELNDHYHTWERILENEDIQNFVKWVSKKLPEYVDTSKETKGRKKKRRR